MKFFIFTTLLLCSLSLNAETQTKENTKLESNITLDLYSDSQDTKGGSVNADIGLNDKFKLIVGGGSQKGTTTQTVFPFKTEEESVKNFTLGAATDSSKKYSGSISYEFWGIKDQFESKGINPNFTYKLHDWIFSLNAGERRLKLFVDRKFIHRTFDTTNPFLTFAVTFTGFKNWYVRAEAGRNWYGDDLSGLSRARAAFFLSPTSLSLANSLQKDRQAFGFGYTFKIAQVGLEGSTATSTIDENLKTKTAQLKTTWFIANDWDLGVNFGNSHSSQSIDNSDNNRFTDILVTYYWQ